MPGRIRNYAVDPAPEGGDTPTDTASHVPAPSPAPTPAPDPTPAPAPIPDRPPLRVPVPPADPIPFSVTPSTPKVPDAWSDDTTGPVPVVVRLAPGALENPTLLDALRANGMNVPDKWIHDRLDRVSGSVDRSRFEALRALPGVLEVNRARTGYGFG